MTVLFQGCILDFVPLSGQVPDLSLLQIPVIRYLIFAEWVHFISNGFRLFLQISFSCWLHSLGYLFDLPFVWREVVAGFCGTVTGSYVTQGDFFFSTCCMSGSVLSR